MGLAVWGGLNSWASPSSLSDGLNSWGGLNVWGAVNTPVDIITALYGAKYKIPYESNTYLLPYESNKIIL